MEEGVLARLLDDLKEVRTTQTKILSLLSGTLKADLPISGETMTPCILARRIDDSMLKCVHDVAAGTCMPNHVFPCSNCKPCPDNSQGLMWAAASCL